MNKKWAGTPLADGTAPAQARQSAPRRAAAVNAAIGALLAAAVALVFVQTGRHRFVNYDDYGYVYGNSFVTQGLTLAGLQRAFTHFDASNWHPLTWISHMADWQVYKISAGGHHLTSLLIHAAVAVLLFLTLLRMTGSRWPSTVVAAVFAIHPLRVESVAWIAERKDVLSGLFFVLTLWAYAGYARHARGPHADPVPKGEGTNPHHSPLPGGEGTNPHPSPLPEGERTWWRYALVVVFFVLGLMCKPMLVTLPLVLLLLDYWPLRRGSRWKGVPLIVEKLPLLLLSLVSCGLTIAAQRHFLVTTDYIGLPMRLGNVVESYTAYLCQFFRPQRLAVFYPYPENLGLAAVLGPLALLISISWVAAVQRRRRPYLLVGWLWYLVMLLPVIGLVQVGLQARADRYTYLALMGPCLALVWAMAELVGRHPRLRPVLSLATCIALAVLTTAAWRQTTTWRDSISLWTHALDSGYESDCAHKNLACAYCEVGKFDLALQNFQDALRLAPNSAQTRVSYGLCLLSLGQADEAIDQYRIALGLDPGDSATETDLGLALVIRGSLAEAAEHFRRAMQLNPENAAACYNLGKVLMRQERPEEAVAALEHCLQLDPDLAAAANDLGNVLHQLRRLEEAEARFRRAIEIDPNYAEAHNHLGQVLEERGQSAEAAGHFRKALRINPNDAQAHDNLGTVLMKQGLVPDAMAEFRAALQLATAAGNLPLAESLSKRIKMYGEGKPRGDAPPGR
jgi:tetratricopeptide (TPR) repeat protein